ncbi:esterase/lipase family protein [Corynebacterium sphenisci]|uniref:esterase/lipase family protein n=1 Tax=Corynebacterium sphenisci TaxID=191493 RepID=UPI0026DFCF37|nr:alpha/beta fold hydrolase [Corynebacterium sphenisci]MDO5731006.1 alpha/beta fold hydrolase [Corynebacterium sphenisci]
MDAPDAPARRAPGPTGPPARNFPLAFLRQLRTRDLLPPGLAGAGAPGPPADPDRPPVVLIHGTWMNAYSTWAMIAPGLRAAGFDVHAFNYGVDRRCRVGRVGGVAGVADLGASAAEVADAVDAVRAATGAERVDLICHSQGAIHGRLYAQERGAGRVRTLISLGGNHHGATLSGASRLAERLTAAGLPVERACTRLLGPAGLQQTPGSPIFERLNSAGELREGVRYVNFASRVDWIATPWAGGFLDHDPARPGACDPAVRNIRVQDLGRGQWPDHLSMLYSPTVLAEIIAALGGPARAPDHAVVVPVWGQLRPPALAGIAAAGLAAGWLAARRRRRR